MPAPVVDAAPVVVLADGFACEGGAPVRTCTSAGAVVITAPGLRVEAAGATLVQQDAAQTLTLGPGWLERDGGGRVRFDTAVLAGSAAAGWVVSGTGADLDAGPGHLHARTAEGASGDPAWRLSDAVYTPCVCADGAPTALTLTARAATLDPEVVRIRGGVVRVFGVPVLPLPPTRLALRPDRFHLLLPELGYGSPGVSAALRGEVGLDGWRVTGGPAWRQDRGARGELIAAGPTPGVDRLGGGASGALGWDSQTGTVRGAASSVGGVVVEGDARTLRAAWDAAWQSDDDYAADYAADWIRRGAPRTEQRAVLALGPARLALHGVDPSPTALDGVEARLRQEWGGSGAAIAARTAVGGAGTGWSGLAPYGEVGVDGRASATRGALHAELAGDAAARATAGAYRLAAAGRGALEVPMWTGRLQLWPGVVGVGRADDAARGFVGAGTRADAVFGDWLLSASAHAGVDESGPTARVTADADGPVQLAIRAGRRQQGGSVGVSTAAVRWTLGGQHRSADGQWLAWGDADAHLGRLRVGGGLSTPLGADTPAWSARALLGYDDGCTRMLVTASVAPDRALPDLGLTVSVRR